MQHFQHALARVAVWNLAGFGGIKPDRKKQQAQGLALLDAELVTLVEVNPVSYIYELAAEISQYGIDYDATIVEQDGNLHTGFLFKKGVDVSNLRLIEGSQGNYERGRKAVAVDVKVGKFKATIIGVHLKAGREKEHQRVRDTQCQVIGKWIDTLRDTPGYKRGTIVLMGDFNMIPGQDVSNFHYLGGDDVMDFVSSWDLQDRFSHILDKGRANLLDGFAVSRTFSKDYVRGSLRLFPMHWTMDMGRERFKDEVSDHLPFVASFKVF